MEHILILQIWCTSWTNIFPSEECTFSHPTHPGVHKSKKCFKTLYVLQCLKINSYKIRSCFKSLECVAVRGAESCWCFVSGVKRRWTWKDSSWSESSMRMPKHMTWWLLLAKCWVSNKRLQTAKQCAVKCSANKLLQLHRILHFTLQRLFMFYTLTNVMKK